MNYTTTQEVWMGHEKSHTNKYGVAIAQEKHEAVTSENTTNVETSQEQSIKLRMPEIIVPNYNARDVEKSRLDIRKCDLIRSAWARAYFNLSFTVTTWISLGNADLFSVEDKTDNGRPWKAGEKRTMHQACCFRSLSKGALANGIRPEHAFLKVAWSKCGGSVFEEVQPFDACCAWAGKREALYIGRKVSRRNDSLAPIHGVDYIVLPIEPVESEYYKLLLGEILSGSVEKAC